VYVNRSDSLVCARIAVFSSPPEDARRALERLGARAITSWNAGRASLAYVSGGEARVVLELACTVSLPERYRDFTLHALLSAAASDAIHYGLLMQCDALILLAEDPASARELERSTLPRFEGLPPRSINGESERPVVVAKRDQLEELLEDLLPALPVADVIDHWPEDDDDDDDDDRLH
jgi:hypothetical protein